MKMKMVAIVSVLTLAVAGTAMARLKEGGLTIGGPGLMKVLSTATGAVLGGLDGQDACITVVNKGQPIDIVITDDTAATSTLSVAVKTMTTHCMPNADNVDVTCPGTRTCSFEWRVDRY